MLCYWDISAGGVIAYTANYIYAYSAEASLNGYVFAQPYQNNTVRRYFGGILSWEKIPFAKCVQYQNQTAQQIKFVFITHFIRIHVCMRKEIRRCKTRSDRKVINTCTEVHQFRSVNKAVGTCRLTSKLIETLWSLRQYLTLTFISTNEPIFFFVKNKWIKKTSIIQNRMAWIKGKQTLANTVSVTRPSESVFGTFVLTRFV